MSDKCNGCQYHSDYCSAPNYCPELSNPLPAHEEEVERLTARETKWRELVEMFCDSTSRIIGYEEQLQINAKIQIKLSELMEQKER